MFDKIVIMDIIRLPQNWLMNTLISSNLVNRKARRLRTFVLYYNWLIRAIISSMI